MDDCLACGLTNGRIDLPGGRIFQTTHWVVEHCIGPFGVGALIVKPFHHCTHIWELSDEEAEELDPLLRLVSKTIQTILKPDQVYVCLWSHAGWEPGHIHFVLQPSWNNLQAEHKYPDPFLQVDMFEAGERPNREHLETFAARAKEVIRNA